MHMTVRFSFDGSRYARGVMLPASTGCCLPRVVAVGLGQRLLPASSGCCQPRSLAVGLEQLLPASTGCYLPQLVPDLQSLYGMTPNPNPNPNPNLSRTQAKIASMEVGFQKGIEVGLQVTRACWQDVEAAHATIRMVLAMR